MISFNKYCGVRCTTLETVRNSVDVASLWKLITTLHVSFKPTPNTFFLHLKSKAMYVKMMKVNLIQFQTVKKMKKLPSERKTVFWGISLLRIVIVIRSTGEFSSRPYGNSRKSLNLSIKRRLLFAKNKKFEKKHLFFTQYRFIWTEIQHNNNNKKTYILFLVSGMSLR